MNPHRFLIPALASVGALVAGCDRLSRPAPQPPAPAYDDGWTLVKRTIRYGISGLAVIRHAPDRTELLAVHDNKKPGEPRLAVITVAADGVDYRPVAWPTGTPEPIDLEAVAAVPGREGSFVALASEGRAYHLAIAGDQVAVVGEFALPATVNKPNYEGLALLPLGDALYVVWGHRGSDKHPGRLNWATLDLAKGKVGEPAGADIRVPWPTAEVRHISDLRLDGNATVWVTAASDPGDDGPYTSAVYAIGSLAGGKFAPNPSPVRLGIVRRKIEAMELVPGPRGGVILGTDDENAGGWLRHELFPAPPTVR
mgnify:CR=1 FL=1